MKELAQESNESTSLSSDLSFQILLADSNVVIRDNGHKFDVGAAMLIVNKWGSLI